MRHLLTILAALLFAAAPAAGQTIKTLGYNTTNGNIVAARTNLTFTNSLVDFQTIRIQDFEINPATISWGGAPKIDAEQNFLEGGDWTVYGALGFNNTTNAATTRTNLGLGATWLTNTNVTNFRSAIELGATNRSFSEIGGADTNLTINLDNGDFFGLWTFDDVVNFQSATTTSGLTNNGDITINQTTASNGLLYVRRTNAEAFLGMANLIASNNTTVSNETLFRVGVSEATNKAAQFGFRSTNTNGNGVAVFSVFGFNALMMVGADASTNAVIYSGGGTNNEVMTLIRDGATEFARPLRFSTNASTKPSTNAPANTTNAAAWVEMRIGTNSYRVPLYQ